MIRQGRVRGSWRLVPYIAPSGRSQVLDFLDSLRLKDFPRFVQVREVLMPEIENRGPFLIGPPIWEGLGAGFYEIRSARVRLYCSVMDPRLVMMYRGVVKRWPRFREEDRRICQRARKDAESDAYDQEKREYLYRGICKKRGQAGPS